MADIIQVKVKNYKGNQSKATKLFLKDAEIMAAQCYFPTSQTWIHGSYGCGAFLFALLLCVIFVGVLIFLYMLLVKPDGTLTVTYEYRGGIGYTSEEKNCPQCDERIKTMAKICRFCGHNFEK